MQHAAGCISDQAPFFDCFVQDTDSLMVQVKALLLYWLTRVHAALEVPEGVASRPSASLRPQQPHLAAQQYFQRPAKVQAANTQLTVMGRACTYAELRSRHSNRGQVVLSQVQHCDTCVAVTVGRYL